MCEPIFFLKKNKACDVLLGCMIDIVGKVSSDSFDKKKKFQLKTLKKFIKTSIKTCL
jgi:hypothetical protein